MRVLLSTIGSRGDVQPLIALASGLGGLGVEVRLTVPPDFCEWIESLGMPVVPIGPRLRPAKAAPQSAKPPSFSAEERLRMVEGTVATQFETIAGAAEGCDVIVGATALQVAAPSVAERMRVPYVFAAYCPIVLPSPRHAPPVLAMLGDTPAPAMDDYGELWVQDARRWNDTWATLLNARRESLGLPPVDDVSGHIVTDSPWLAADSSLAPWPEADDGAVFQTGAWILSDTRPLPPDLEAFLAAGEPPVYCGFGSNLAADGLSDVFVGAVRAAGRRAILSRGWAGLSLVDDEPDCIAIGEVNEQALFKRVAAVVHHGGAGTTTAATRAGAPQVVIPQHYDQHHWARRIHDLGIGIAHPGGMPTRDSLRGALERTLQHGVAERARSVAPTVRTDGARTAALRLINDAGSLR